MYNTGLDFYLIYSSLGEINLGNFRNKILAIFNNDNDDLYRYNFFLEKLYFVHLFVPEGKVISILPFELLSLDDNEDLIDDLYFDILISINKYLAILKIDEYSENTKIGLYISSVKESGISPIMLFKEKQICSDNASKMRTDLQLPLSLIKK